MFRQLILVTEMIKIANLNVQTKGELEVPQHVTQDKISAVFKIKSLPDIAVYWSLPSNHSFFLFGKGGVLEKGKRAEGTETEHSTVLCSVQYTTVHQNCIH